jgi:hypothetical protein
VIYKKLFTISSGKELVRSLGPYSAPKSIASSLDFIIGGIGFPRLEKVNITYNI